MSELSLNCYGHMPELNNKVCYFIILVYVVDKVR